MSDNRRKNSRYPLQAKVTVTMNDVILNDTRCTNISAGGMCISVGDCVETADAGMLILVHKCTEEVTFFQTNFTVSWNNTILPYRKNAQMGISFMNIDNDNKKALNQIISFQASCHN